MACARLLLSLLLALLLALPAAATDAPFDAESRAKALRLVDELTVGEDAAALSRAVAVGHIADRAGFERALAVTLARKADRDARTAELPPDMQAALQRAAAEIFKLDRDHAGAVGVHNKAGEGTPLLFDEVNPAARSYRATMDLALKFDPSHNSDDHARLAGDIDAYLAGLADDPCIRYALAVTKSDMARLKANWFGSGRGFEHVFSGELKDNQVSGYHWWYKFYCDERAGRARLVDSIGPHDPKFYCGSFRWDPDGSGGAFQPAFKRKGSFAIAMSAPALLALGHVAMEVSRRHGSPSSFNFRGNANGGTYVWQVYTFGGNLRSVFPMAQKKEHPERVREARELLVQDMLPQMRIR